MATDADDERAVLEVVEFSDSEDEDFEYKAVEVKDDGRGMTVHLFLSFVVGEPCHSHVLAVWVYIDVLLWMRFSFEELLMVIAVSTTNAAFDRVSFPFLCEH